MKKVVILFCTCILLFGCSSNPAIDIQAEADAIRNMEEQWSAALKKGDVETIVKFYANDAVYISSGKPMAIGLKAIEDATRSMLADTALLLNEYSGTIDAVEVSASGDIAYTRGHDVMPLKTPDGIVRNQGRWVDVWKKFDGQWKVVVLMSNEIPPESNSNNSY